jgi:hypothetical protein
MTESICNCIACRKDFDYTKHIIDKPTNRPGVTQYGVRCPHCRFFVHTHYMDEGLKQKRDRLAQTLVVYSKARNDRTWQAYQREKKEYQAAFNRLNPPRGKAQSEQSAHQT